MAVDASARTITIERTTPKGTKTLELEVTKKAGDLGTVKAGDKISFSYDPDLEVVTKIAEVAKKTEKGAAVGDDSMARPFLNKLLKAIEENDYDSYIANSSAIFKAEATKQQLAAVNELLAPRMKKGYDIVYLAEFNQRGVKHYMWKLSLKDGGDDWLIRLTLKEGKVSGFWIQN